MIRWKIVDWKTRYWDVTIDGVNQKGHTESLVYYINRVGYWEISNNPLSVYKHEKIYFIR